MSFVLFYCVLCFRGGSLCFVLLGLLGWQPTTEDDAAEVPLPYDIDSRSWGPERGTSEIQDMISLEWFFLVFA